VHICTLVRTLDFLNQGLRGFQPQEECRAMFVIPSAGLVQVIQTVTGRHADEWRFRPQ